MVTLLKDYEQQTYFLNSGDDIDGIVFRNGDQVFLMDQNLLLIYDEGNDNWQPVPTGGGGGGWQLLDSGTYTAVSDASSITIPFTENTDYALIYVELNNPPTSTAKTCRWVRMMSRGKPSQMTIGRFITGEYQNTNNTSTYVADDLSNTAIISPYNDNAIVRRYSSSYPIKAGTYNWYLWGV